MHSHANPLEKFSSLLVSVFFGLAMVLMYYFNDPANGSRSLISLLAWWIQLTVLGAGIVLLLLSFFQFIGLWLQPSPAPAHAHEHGKECAHDHADQDGKAGDHGHAEGKAHTHEHHDGCSHAHDHEHDHKHHAGCEQEHHHGHADCDHDHDHGWVPIRFVPLVVPLILCLMGLPNESMIRAYENALIERSAKHEDGAQQLRISAINPVLGFANVGLTYLSNQGMGLTAANLTSLPWVFGSEAVIAGFDKLEWENWDDSIKPTVTDLEMLERIADSRAQHDEWKQKPAVEVEGMIYFGPKTPDGKQFFRVVRLRVACCLGDASPATMPCLFRSTLEAKNQKLKQERKAVINSGDWVAVRGRLEFAIMGGRPKAVMRVYEVEKRPIPTQPYL